MLQNGIYSNLLNNFSLHNNPFEVNMMFTLYYWKVLFATCQCIKFSKSCYLYSLWINFQWLIMYFMWGNISKQKLWKFMPFQISAIHYCSWVLAARILEWFPILSSSGPCCQNSSLWSVWLGWLYSMAHGFISYISPFTITRL